MTEEGMVVDAAAVLAYAESFVGMGEDRGSNRGVRLDPIQRSVSQVLGWGDWLLGTPGNGEPWCGTWLFYIYWKCGVAVAENPAHPSTETMWLRAQANGTLSTVPMIGGPIVWRGVHTGLVVGIGQGVVQTIEGNAGDMVARKTRPIAGAHRFIRTAVVTSKPVYTSFWIEDVRAAPKVWGPWAAEASARKVLAGLPPARRNVSTVVQTGKGLYAIREGTPRNYGPWAVEASRDKALPVLERRLGRRLRPWNQRRYAPIEGVAEALGKTT